MSGRPLRFLMVTTFYPPHGFGGDGIFVRRLSEELARRGNLVDVAYSLDAWRLLSRREPPPLPAAPNIVLHPLRSPWGPLAPLAAHQTGRPFMLAPLRKLLSGGHDVVNFHNISLMGGPAVLSQGNGVRLLTLHDYWLLCPAHVLFRFDRQACDRPRWCAACVLRNSRPPQWWRLGGLMRKSLGRLDAVIGHSRHVLERHRSAFPTLRLEHLPGFCPHGGEEVAAAPPVGIEKPYLLYVGRLERLKGPQTLIPLARARGWRLVVAGAGSLEAELRRAADGRDDIRFTGFIEGPALRKLVRDAAALVVPSLCPEIMALVVLEAFREGTPVIARDIGGMREAVAESGAGFLYRTDDELAAAAEQILADGALRRELGARARRAWEERYTPERYVDDYLALVGRLQAKKPRPR